VAGDEMPLRLLGARGLVIAVATGSCSYRRPAFSFGVGDAQPSGGSGGAVAVFAPNVTHGSGGGTLFYSHRLEWDPTAPCAEGTRAALLHSVVFSPGKGGRSRRGSAAQSDTIQLALAASVPAPAPGAASSALAPTPAPPLAAIVFDCRLPAGTEEQWGAAGPIDSLEWLLGFLRSPGVLVAVGLAAFGLAGGGGSGGGGGGFESNEPQTLLRRAAAFVLPGIIALSRRTPLGGLMRLSGLGRVDERDVERYERGGWNVADDLRRQRARAEAEAEREVASMRARARALASAGLRQRRAQRGAAREDFGFGDGDSDGGAGASLERERERERELLALLEHEREIEAERASGNDDAPTDSEGEDVD